MASDDWADVGERIKDARQMVSDKRSGIGTIESADDLEQVQSSLLRRLKLTRRRQDSAAPLPAYVSDNRWVADCPNCGAGIAVWEGQARTPCLECGHEYAIDFPPEAERRRAERILARRPRKHRHWLRDRGETADTLAAENRAHGVATGDEPTEPAPREPGA
jgi:hypothetical protein